MSPIPRPGRRSIRLPEHDYAGPGVYFVTACTQERRCLFGDIIGEQMVLNERGRIVQSCWQAIPDHFSDVLLDEFVVMPNHLHGLISIIEASVGATHGSPPGTARGPGRRSLGAIVGSFKTASGQLINRARATPSGPVWQRSYYEHVVRNEAALDKIRQYIADNPRRWAEDGENPAVIVLRGL